MHIIIANLKFTAALISAFLKITHSPVYIDSTANIRMAVERIIWAKCVCFGQTCVAPDYVLCAKDVEQQFINEAKAVIKEFFGENVQNSKDLGRVINARHFSRLRQLLDTTRGQIVVGGKVDEFDLFIEPTIIGNVEFGEILVKPILFYHLCTRKLQLK